MDPTSIQPLGDRVLVEAIKETATDGGVILAASSQGRPERAKVLAVGPGAWDAKTGTRIPLGFEVGDEIIFHRMAGTHVGGLDHSFIIFREQDILAKVVPSD